MGTEEPAANLILTVLAGYLHKSRRAANRLRTQMGELFPHEICLKELLRRAPELKLLQIEGDQEVANHLRSQLIAVEPFYDRKKIEWIALINEVYPNEEFPPSKEWSNYLDTFLEKKGSSLMPHQLQILINAGGADFSELYRTGSEELVKLLIQNRAIPNAFSCWSLFVRPETAPLVPEFLPLMTEEDRAKVVRRAIVYIGSLTTPDMVLFRHLLDTIPTSEDHLQLAFNTQNFQVLNEVVSRFKDQELLMRYFQISLRLGLGDNAVALSAHLGTIPTTVIDMALKTEIKDSDPLPGTDRHRARWGMQGEMLWSIARRQWNLCRATLMSRLASKNCPDGQKKIILGVMWRLWKKNVIKEQTWKSAKEKATLHPPTAEAASAEEETIDELTFEEAIDDQDFAQAITILENSKITIPNLSMDGLYVDLQSEISAKELFETLLQRGCCPLSGLLTAVNLEDDDLIWWLLEKAKEKYHLETFFEVGFRKRKQLMTDAVRDAKPTLIEHLIFNLKWPTPTARNSFLTSRMKHWS